MINEHTNTSGKTNFDGVKRRLETEFSSIDVVTPSATDIQHTLLEISRSVSKRLSDNPHRILWRDVCQSLDVKHPSLKGVFSRERIKALEAASTSSSKKVSTASSKNGHTTKKRKVSVVDSNSSADESEPVTDERADRTDTLDSPLSSAPETEHEGDDDDEDEHEHVTVAPHDAKGQTSKTAKMTLTNTTGDSVVRNTPDTAKARRDIESQRLKPSSEKEQEFVVDAANPIVFTNKQLLNLSSDGPDGRSTGADDPHETFYILAKKIENAIDPYVKLLAIKQNQPVMIRNREWSSDLKELMQAVFADERQPDRIATQLANIVHEHGLSVTLFLRSLVAAAILKCAMLPDPANSAREVNEKGHYSKDRTLDALLGILTEHTTKPQRNKLRHLVAQSLVIDLLGEHEIRDDEVMKAARGIGRAKNDSEMLQRSKALMRSAARSSEIRSNEMHDRATLLGQRLFIAISCFLAPEELGPSDEHDKRMLRRDLNPFRPVRSFQDPSMNQMSSFLSSETPQLQQDLSKIFEIALTFRSELVKRFDAIYEFDFPHFGMLYSEHEHVDEKLAARGKAHVPSSQAQVSTSERVIIVTTMFGMRASVREKYTDEDYGDWRIMTRAMVQLL